MKFINKTAFRYTFSSAKNQKHSTLIIVLGVCVSIAAILILGSVMNGLQSAQLDKLRNLDSFDIIVENTKLSKSDIENINDVEYVYEFIDANVLISNISSGKSGTARIRGINLDSYHNQRTEKDFSYVNYLNNDEGLILSTTMQNRFGCNVGDNLQVTFLRKGKTTVAPYNRNFQLSGLYISSLSDFSSNTAFVSIDELMDIYGESFVKFGIFCNQNVDYVCSLLSSFDSNAKITGWKDANKALYSALLLEKALMYLFLGFILLIISFNLKNSTKRLIDNKIGEIAILRSCGMSKSDVYRIFILQAVFAALIGLLLGLVIGFICVSNLSRVLTFVDRIILRISGNISYLSTLPLTASFNWLEAILISIYTMILTVVFSFIGCRKINKLQIMEIVSNASNKI